MADCDVTTHRNYLVDGDWRLEIGDGISENDTILRYMSFPKFQSSLQDGLRLTRADVFSQDDPFEGEYTEQVYRIAQLVSSVNNGKTLKENLKEECNKSRRLAFVSCWTLSESENVALWKFYGGHDNSVAVKTNVFKLKGAIEKYLRPHNPNDNINLLKWMAKRFVGITYIDHRRNVDYEKMHNLRNAEILHYKNIGYAYEEEIRIIFDSSQPGREAVGEKITEK